MSTLHRLLPLSISVLAACATAACSSAVTEDTSSTTAAALGGAVDADAATEALLARFWNGAYLRDADPATPGACGDDACTWIFAEAFDAVLDGVQRTGGRRFSSWVRRLYDAQDARGWIEPHGAKYFDDENWMALALIRAYDVTRDAKYLCHAVRLYRDIKSEGFDWAGGRFSGIWWNAAHTEKATASNFGPAITAARLHERPEMDACPAAQAGFVDAAAAGRDARVVYEHWRAAMTRVDAQGDRRVADHASGACAGGVCWWDFTYDQGLGIGAALALHHITGDGRFASDAYELASYMIHHEATGGVLHDGGSCGGDCAAFKGIGYRFLLQLYELDTSQAQYGDVLRASAQAIWGAARDAQNDTFGTEWAGPAPGSTTLAADASAVMALNLAVEWGIAAPAPPPPPPPSSCGRLEAGATLGSGASIASCDGRLRLVVQAHDGNVVLYGGSAAQWASGTVGHAGDRLVMQDDGNLVAYGPSNHPLWYAGTVGHPGAYLAVQDDGNLVVYDGSTAIWARFGLPTQTCSVRCCDGTLHEASTTSSAACRGDFEICDDHGHGRVEHMKWDGQDVYWPVQCR